MKKRVLSFLLSFLMIISLTPSVLLTAMEVKAEVAPSATDSRYVNSNVSAVRNQGSLGLCWAFSTIAACEAELIQNNGAPSSIDLSELHLGYFGFNRSADPLGNYTAGKNQLQNLDNPAEPKDWVSKGHNQYAAMNALAAWSGVVTETTTPYVSTEEDAWEYFNSKTDEELAALSYNNDTYHLENAYLIDRNNPEDIKQAILDYGAVVVGISADSGMLQMSAQYDDTHHSFYHPANADTDHEVVIVGWDDDFNDFEFEGTGEYTPLVPENSGAWLIKNSWGTTAGDNGYFWMSYEDKTISRWLYAYDMESADNFDNNYQYNNDITGMFSGEDVTDDIYDYTPKNSSKWAAANVFTIKANPSGYETLNAVSFMTYAANGNYTIRIYTDLLDESNPESGTLKATLTGSYKYAGYHTIRTESPIPLAEGTTVSICVDIVDENGRQLGLAGVENSLGIDAKAKAGQSFLAEYGAWMDRNKVSQSVVAIKAFTKNVTGTTPTGINFAKGDYYISTTGNGEYIRPNITGATYPALTWSSSNESVATVLPNGKIKPVAEGECTITATTTNDLSADCTIHVIKGPSAVTYVSYNSKAWLKDDNTDGYYILAAPSEKATRFVVSRMLCDGSDQYEADVSSLREGYSYYVWVQPFKLYGENNDIEILGPVGQYDYRYYSVDYTGTIENFRVTAKTSTSVTLKWNIFNNIDHYELTYSDSSYHSIKVYDESYTVTGLQPGTSYSFRIRGVGPTMIAREVHSEFVYVNATTLDSCFVNELVYDTQKDGFSVSSKEELLTAISVLAGDLSVGLKNENGSSYIGPTRANIYLNNDINLGEKTISISDVTLNLYLDGHTLSSVNDCVFTVSGSDIKVFGGDGGKIKSTHSGAANDILIYQKSGVMTISNCTLDYTNTTATNMIQVDAGQLTLTNVTMDKSSCNTLIHLISQSDTTASITLNNCTLKTDYTAIQSTGGKVTVNGGTITCKEVAIYTSPTGSVPVDVTIKGDAEIKALGGTSTASSRMIAAIDARGPVDLQSGTITGFNVGIKSTSNLTISGGVISANRALLSPNASIGLWIAPSGNDSTRTIAISGGDFFGMPDNTTSYLSYGIYNTSGVATSSLCATGYHFNEAAIVDLNGIMGYVYCSAVGSAARTCNIVYNLNGDGDYLVDGSSAVNSPNNPNSYELGSGTIPLDDPTLEGKVFVGWYTRYNGFYWGHGYIDLSNPSASTTYYAHWRNPYYYVYFNANGGTGTADIMTCDLNTNYTLYTNKFKKTGYVFTGWNTKKDGTGTAYGNKATINNLRSVDGSSITLYAQWAKADYTISFNANGGSGKMASLACKYGTAKALTANAFTRKGYTFVGWNTKKDGTGTTYANKASVTNLTKTGAITLYAKWTKTKYTITYYLYGGKNSTSNPSYYYITSAKITLKNPTRAGYTFGGWYSDSKFKTKVTTIAAGSTGAKKLYAKWTVNTYNLAYNANGGTGKMTGKSGIKYDSSFTLASNTFTRKGYTFAGWSTSKTGKVLYKNKASVKNLTATNKKTVTLYAIWTKTKYTITYYLDGGTNSSSNPAYYYITTGKITLKNPTKTGYTFGGWYADSKFKTKVTTIAAGSTKSMKLYAKWTAKSFTVSFNMNGGSGSKTAIKTTSGKTIDLRATSNMKLVGYDFKNWNTKADGTGTMYSAKSAVAIVANGNITLYAIWGMQEPTYSVENRTITVTKGYDFNINSEFIQNILPESQRNEEGTTYFVNDCTITGSGYERLLYGKLQKKESDGSLSAYDGKFRTAEEWAEIDRLYRAQQKPNTWTYVKENGSHAIRITGTEDITITIPSYSLPDGSTMSLTFTIKVRQ